jgi:hypothetical protein
MVQTLKEIKMKNIALEGKSTIQSELYNIF